MRSMEKLMGRRNSNPKYKFGSVMRTSRNPRIDFAYDSNFGESLGGISERNGRQREMATFRYRWRLFAEQTQGNSLESHQSHTLVAFSLMATSMVMGETSSDFDMLGVLASKIRVWRCVGIMFVFFSVCSENIQRFYRFTRFPGSSEHFRAATHTHTQTC